MSIFDRARAKAEELLGRAEELYGESHGDAAATVAGEAHQLEAGHEAGHQAGHEAAQREAREPGDDGRGEDGLAAAR